MGIVLRQSIKYSIVNYFGLLVSALATIFVYPNALEPYGLVRFLLDTVMLLYPIATLGLGAIIIRFFPKFSNPANGHNGFLSLILLWGAVGAAIFLLASFATWNLIHGYYATKVGNQADYLIFIAPLLILTIFSNILSQYAACFNRIVIPSFLNDFSTKIAVPVLILGYLGHWISISGLIWGLVIHASLITFSFVIYIKSLKQWHFHTNFNFLTKKLKLEMLEFGGFGILVGLGFQLVNNLGGWMVASLLGLASNGKYAIIGFLANMLDIPSRGIVNISTPLVAEYWSEKKYDKLHSLYEKSSINLLVVGLLLFGSFWISIDELFQLIPNGAQFLIDKNVAFYLGMAKVVDMATGINNHIVYYSKYYRYVLISLLVLALGNISLNLVLIPRMGITGAALATMISNVLYNTISVTLLWRKFGFKPFTKNTILALLISIITFVLIGLIPKLHNTFLSLIVHSGLYFGIYSFCIIQFRVSSDISDFLNQLKKGARKTLGL